MPNYRPDGSPFDSERLEIRLPRRRRSIPRMGRRGAVTLLAIAVGVTSAVAVRTIARPRYAVRATVLITTEEGRPTQMGLDDSWVGLLKSFQVTDAVVERLRLELRTYNGDADRNLFAGFVLNEGGFLPSRYELLINRSTKRWVLRALVSRNVSDSGSMVDSVGLKFGLKWHLNESAFAGKGIRVVPFTVVTPREAAVEAIHRLSVERKGNMISLMYEDPDSQLAAAIVNDWVKEFSRVSNELAARKRVTVDAAIETQLSTARDEMEVAERRLEATRNRGVVPENGRAAPRAESEENKRAEHQAESARTMAVARYTALRHRAEAAATETANAEPSVVMALDTAVAPLEPNRDRRAPIALLTGIGATFLGAFVVGALRRRGA